MKPGAVLESHPRSNCLFSIDRDTATFGPMQSKTSASLQQLWEGLTRLRDGWPGRGWSWDNRFQALASSISTELGTTARAATMLALPLEWTEGTLRNAPPSVQDIATQTGGVRSDQVVFTANAVGGVTPFGLWWPWNNGITVSLRVGLHGAITSEQAKLRELFRCTDT